MNTAILAWSQFYLPLYVVHTISSMGPVFVCIINYYLHNMKITQNQINGNIVAFAGIFFTINGKSIASLFIDV
jgi:drug/metabolite transporter (DMT)-like permease